MRPLKARLMLTKRTILILHWHLHLAGACYQPAVYSTFKEVHRVKTSNIKLGGCVKDSVKDMELIMTRPLLR